MLWDGLRFVGSGENYPPSPYTRLMGELKKLQIKLPCQIR